MYWPLQKQSVTACMHALQVLLNQRTFYSPTQQDIYTEPQSECTYIYINTREKTTNMHHSLFIQKDQLSLRVPMNTPTQLLSHVRERTINTAIILSKVPDSQLHYYLHRLISLGFVLRLFTNKDCRNWMANSFHRMTQSRAWVITGSLFSF